MLLCELPPTFITRSYFKTALGEELGPGGAFRTRVCPIVVGVWSLTLKIQRGFQHKGSQGADPDTMASHRGFPKLLPQATPPCLCSAFRNSGTGAQGPRRAWTGLTEFSGLVPGGQC